MRTITTLALLGLTGLSTTAAAAENQVDFILNSQTTNADGWQIIDNDGAHSSFGARVGVAMGEHLSILGSYHYGSTGADVFSSDWDDEGIDPPGDGFTMAYFGHGLAVGPKVSSRINRIATGYATAQLSGQLATIRVDADDVLDDDATQLQERGFAPGAVAALGAEFNLPFNRRAWTPAAHVELGYGHTLNMTFDTFGQMNFSGFYANWGVGVRF